MLRSLLLVVALLVPVHATPACHLTQTPTDSLVVNVTGLSASNYYAVDLTGTLTNVGWPVAHQSSAIFSYDLTQSGMFYYYQGTYHGYVFQTNSRYYNQKLVAQCSLAVT